MLVLTRKWDESVVLADEITVTVERVSDREGARLTGTRVRLGFQCPRYVTIERSECRSRSAGFSRGAGRMPARPRAGTLTKIDDAEVCLRIHVPPRVPVRLNGAPTAQATESAADDRGSGDAMAMHRITCRPEDVITICGNISVAPVGIFRFVPADASQPDEERNVSEVSATARSHASDRATAAPAVSP